MKITGTLHTDDGREVRFAMQYRLEHGMWMWTTDPTEAEVSAERQLINQMAIGLNSYPGWRRTR